MIPNKNKPKIVDIPQSKQEEARKLLESNVYRSKHIEINALSGICCICGKIPTKIVKYDVSDADDDSKVFRVERYCSPCFERDKSKDKVLLTATNGKDKTIAVVDK